LCIGKKIRLSRIIEPYSKSAVIVPMDHGVEGYFERLENPEKIISDVLEGGANALLLRRGIIKQMYKVFAGRAGLILRVTCATGLSSDPSYQKIVSSVEEAIRLGADAVIAMVNVGHPKEDEMIHNFGILSDECDEWEIPLIGEVYPWESKFKNVYDFDVIRQGVRVLSEEGADLIKTSYTGDKKSFEKVVNYSLSPIILAGGPKKDSLKDVLIMVKNAVDAGAIGICIGRNIWQSKNPKKTVQAIAKIVRDRASVEEAEKLLESS